ncbi:MAG: DUF3014 domain-containing protein [Gammaproteobacteria bacterium]
MNTVTKILVALLLLAGAGYVAWRVLQPEAPRLAELVQEAPERVRKALTPSGDTAMPGAPTPVPEGASDSTIEHPVETDPYAALPTLERSDGEFLDGLKPLLPGDAIARHFDTQGFIRRIVVAVDNLPGGRLPMKQRPVKAVGGEFVADGDDDDALTLSPSNYARYEPLIALAEQVDANALAALYRRYYPLFQQAWQELGYPDAYFNDRLVAVIDHLLAAEPVHEPVRLVRPHVLYRYADPALEALSPGHKILVRMGPQNAERTKAVLRKWRAAIVSEEAGKRSP